MTTVILMNSAGEKRGEQVILFDAVVEGVDHPGEGIVSSGPFVKRRGGLPPNENTREVLFRLRSYIEPRGAAFSAH